MGRNQERKGTSGKGPKAKSKKVAAEVVVGLKKV